jgi:hypothetical protein
VRDQKVREAWRAEQPTVTTMCRTAQITPRALGKILTGLGLELVRPHFSEGEGHDSLAAVARAARRLARARVALDSAVRAGLSAGLAVSLVAQVSGLTTYRVERVWQALQTELDATRTPLVRALARSRVSLELETAQLESDCRPVIDRLAALVREIAAAAVAEDAAAAEHEEKIISAWRAGAADAVVLASRSGADPRTVHALLRHRGVK